MPYSTFVTPSTDGGAEAPAMHLIGSGSKCSALLPKQHSVVLDFNVKNVRHVFFNPGAALLVISVSLALVRVGGTFHCKEMIGSTFITGLS